MTERRPFWEQLLVGTGESPRTERERMVLEYVVHRVKGGAGLRGALQEDYVRRNCSQAEIGRLLEDPRLAHAARERMEQPLEAG